MRMRGISAAIWSRRGFRLRGRGGWILRVFLEQLHLIALDSYREAIQFARADADFGANAFY